VRPSSDSTKGGANVPTKAIAAVAAAAFVLAAPAAGGSGRYSDKTGDGAVDIAAVEVTNTAGTITFKIAVANMPALAPDAAIAVAIDADRDDTTGGEYGPDFAAVLFGDDRSAALVRWNGSDFEAFSHGPVDGRYSAGVATISVPAADLGNPSSFDFGVVGIQGDEFDVAPDDGIWTYEMPAVVAAAVHFSPAQPKAGARFAADRVSLRLTDGTTVRPDTLTCIAQLGGRPLVGTGHGGCTWKLPRAARGKRLVVAIGVTYGGMSPAYDSWTFVVR
jgi:hypothetical protein